MPRSLVASSIRTVRSFFQPVALPSVCAICQAWPSQPICGACSTRFVSDEARCARCAVALPASDVVECGHCTVAPPPLARCIAAVAWTWPWNECIARFKFGQEPGWAAALLPLLKAAPGAAALLSEADLVLPVPLSAERMRERGFNQAHELARRLAPEKTEARLLRRVHASPPQSSLGRAARIRNVRGVFALDPARAATIKGRQALLVDDVMTTGATLFEAARTLHEAGAARVTALVLARADEAQTAI